jgi:hypothetical protein
MTTQELLGFTAGAVLVSHSEPDDAGFALTRAAARRATLNGKDDAETVRSKSLSGTRPRSIPPSHVPAMTPAVPRVMRPHIAPIDSAC